MSKTDANLLNSGCPTCGGSCQINYKGNWWMVKCAEGDCHKESIIDYLTFQNMRRQAEREASSTR